MLFFKIMYKSEGECNNKIVVFNLRITCRIMKIFFCKKDKTVYNKWLFYKFFTALHFEKS